MNKLGTIRLVLAGLFTALVFLATTFIKVNFPSVQGVYNAGDAVIIVSAYVLGGPFAAIAGAIGSALSDLAAGYASYAVATLVIKGLMGLVAGSIMSRTKGEVVRIIFGAIVAEIIMIAGYFGYEYFLYKNAAFLGLVPNSMQAVFGVIVGVLLIFALRKPIKNFRSKR